MRCEDFEAQVEALVVGALDSAAAEACEGHLLICTACADLHAREAAFEVRLREALTVAVPPRVRVQVPVVRPGPRFAPWVAAAVVALAAVAAWWMTRPEAAQSWTYTQLRRPVDAAALRAQIAAKVARDGGNHVARDTPEMDRLVALGPDGVRVIEHLLTHGTEAERWYALGATTWLPGPEVSELLQRRLGSAGRFGEVVRSTLLNRGVPVAGELTVRFPGVPLRHIRPEAFVTEGSRFKAVLRDGDVRETAQVGDLVGMPAYRVTEIARDRVTFEPVDPNAPDPRPVIKILNEVSVLPTRKRISAHRVEDLSLMAVVTGTKVNRAMVTDRSGLGHVVREGDIVGIEPYRVVRITRTELVLRRVGPGEPAEIRKVLRPRDEFEDLLP